MKQAVPERGADPTAALSRAFGEPQLRGLIRVRPDDFQVDETTFVEPSGSGEHLLLRVTKTGANTEWVARALAGALGVRRGDVGYAGRKDRRAVTTQWFSVRLPGAEPAGWQAALPDEVTVLECHRHARKLRAGALTGNRFVIRLRELEGEPGLLEQRLAHVAREGVPNYFGPQRFGRDGANLTGARQLFSRNRRARRSARYGMLLSAARSLLFNAVLERRVADASWNTLLQGDAAMPDGRRSVFAVDELDEELRARAGRLDIHPTGPLWGRGSLMTRGVPEALEREVCGREPQLCAGLERAGMEQARRALRLAVREASLQVVGGVAEIRFWLCAGGFATSVLRELLLWREHPPARASR